MFVWNNWNNGIHKNRKYNVLLPMRSLSFDHMISVNTQFKQRAPAIFGDSLDEITIQHTTTKFSSVSQTFDRKYGGRNSDGRRCPIIAYLPSTGRSFGNNCMQPSLNTMHHCLRYLDSMAHGDSITDCATVHPAWFHLNFAVWNCFISPYLSAQKTTNL